MKKTLVLISVLMLSLGLASTAMSAEKKQEKKAVTVGVGVAHGSGETLLFVPIKLNKIGLWLEPYLGVNVNSPDAGFDTKSYMLGTGVFYDFYTTKQTAVYAGGRLGVGRETSDDPFVKDGTVVELEPAIGFSYFPVAQFSLGAEAGIVARSAPNDDSVKTNGRLFLRYFFN